MPAAVAPSNAEEVLNEARRCLSERFFQPLLLLSSHPFVDLLLFIFRSSFVFQDARRSIVVFEP